MAREIEKINIDKWLNLVNMEQHPSLDHVEVHYYDKQQEYFAALISGYGIFMSPPFRTGGDPLPILEEKEKELFVRYENTKKRLKPIKPLDPLDKDSTFAFTF